MDVGNLISGSSAFSKPSLYIWKFSVHILLKPSLKDFEHILASMWDECNCTVLWTFFSIALLWDWNESWPFPVLWPLLSFPDLNGLSWKQTKIILSCLRLHPSTVFQTLLLTMRNMPFFPILVHISSIMVRSCELNSTIPIHFSLWIPKRPVFTLAISYLTLSNFTWFMDLAFQVPKQFCSCQHRTLL